jgi:hypothetical protein
LLSSDGSPGASFSAAAKNSSASLPLLRAQHAQQMKHSSVWPGGQNFASHRFRFGQPAQLL